MPFIHIKSLPLERPLDVRAVIEGLSEDFAAATGIDLEHVTVTWEFLLPGYYAAGGRSVMHQPRHSHPVLVDMLAPDFNAPETVETMLTAVAHSFSERTDIPVTNIFINHRAAQSGRVFDGGEIVRW
jgi:phenylpyruvate tautomerase PptA (4-oxalocrotonate tautomerase family)